MIALPQVRSLAYVIVPFVPFPTGPAVVESIRQSPLDLVILGNVNPMPAGLITRKGADDPLSNKIVLGYIDIGESTDITTRTWLGIDSVARLPDWFGKPNPGWLNPDPLDSLYTVQYWHPAWLDVVKKQIAAQVAAGFDGIFLDVVGAYWQWAPGNAFGNPVKADGMALMVQLVADIRAYVDSLQLGRPFYLVGNGVDGFAAGAPQLYKSLDAVFNENMLWHHNPANGRESLPEANPTSLLAYLSGAFAGQLVFGNDYPPLGDESQVFASFRAATNQNWVPTVNAPFQTSAVLATGPFMFMTSAAAPAAVGSATLTNYMAGGNAPHASLTGGAARDWFIGGMGTTQINAGGGNDVIHAHPDAAYKTGELVLTLSGNTVQGIAPVVNVLVNGNMVAAGVQVTASRGAGQTQDLVLPVAGMVVTSIEIQHTNDLFISTTEDRNVYIGGITLNGQVVPLSSGVYQREYGLADIAGQADMAWGGYMRFGPAALQAAGGTGARAGTTTVDGGTGMDTVVYQGKAGDYAVTAQPTGWAVALRSGQSSADQLGNVDRILFDDRKGSGAAAQITASSGGERIDAGAGLDTIVYAGARGGYTLERAGGAVNVRHAGGADVLLNVERLVFADARVALDTDGSGGMAYRLYQAAFDRTPDAAGLGYQMNALDEGLNIAQVAGNFIASPEFQKTYGALSDTQFVTQLYQNVLHRAPDAGGLAFHVNNLASGANTRANVLVGFSESPENQAALIGAIQNGMVYTI